MAYKDSGEIAWGSGYNLGDYSFRLERSSVPGSTNDKIEAICTKDSKNARKSIQVPSSTRVLGWYVEANETEASVYILIHSDATEIDTGNVEQPIPTSSSLEINYGKSGGGTKPWYTNIYSGDAVFFGTCTITRDSGGSYRNIYAASPNPGTTITEIRKNNATGKTYVYEHRLNSAYTYDGKTVHFWGVTYSSATKIYSSSGFVHPYITLNKRDQVMWAMVYGTEEKDEEKLIARFAIEIEDAGGVGPGGGIDGGWTDPEDYDEDWEEGDPTHTLYVTVTGALSGRHNDPIEDPSYSYIPADKETVKDYGCGGDGGHGGGGGAGASTVVIHKFATNQANSKEVTAIARRHGYGSGGGKGGKGGDGCILIYY